MKLNPPALAQYQDMYKKDPLSKVFAPLAESYREMGLIQEGLQVASEGVTHHPNYASGWIVYGRLQMAAEKPQEALVSLTKALELDGTNLLTYELLGQVHLILEDPRQALAMFKLLLFYNPQSTKAKNAILKLETLTAQDYEEFAPHNLKPQMEVLEKHQPQSESYLQRQLSVFEALLIKGDFASCEILATKLRREFPDHPEVLAKLDLLELQSPEPAEAIFPIESREKRILELKLKRLRSVLSVLETKKSQILNSI
jgi:tetratricopeptide (TPR) repeat protein